MSKQIALP